MSIYLEENCSLHNNKNNVSFNIRSSVFVFKKKNNKTDNLTCISSWGSGANPWGPEKDDQFSKPNHWDGMLEIVGVTGVVHLGQIQSGLRGAMRIAQVLTCTKRFCACIERNIAIYYHASVY